MTTRTADSKGRISLGSRFANQTVIVEDIDPTEVRVTLRRSFRSATLAAQESQGQSFGASGPEAGQNRQGRQIVARLAARRSSRRAA